MRRRAVIRPFFQRLQSKRHARTMRAEHQAEKFMGEGHFLAIDAIVRIKSQRARHSAVLLRPVASAVVVVT